MERYRHDRIRIGEHVAARGEKQCAQRLSEEAASLVFEGVDQLAHRAVVSSGAPRHRVGRRMTAAALAAWRQRGRAVELIAADLAEWRSDRRDATPARVADCAAQ